MSKRSGFYPCPAVDTAGSMVVSQAGGVLLTETARAVGLAGALSAGLAPWRAPTAVHDPAKVLVDLAVTLAMGGDCLADIAVLRAEPGLYGLVASDPTVSRTVDRLAADAVAALGAINTARAPGAGAWRGGWPVTARPTTGSTAGAPLDHRRRRHPGHRALNWHWHRFSISGRAVSGQDVCSWRVATFKV